MAEPTPPTPSTLEELAETIEAQAQASDARVATERLSLDMQGKLRPKKPQAEPCGLFEQTQGTLL